MSAGKSSWTGDEIIRELETIFPDAECELHHDTPFQLLVAVVLSAQTTDAAVNRVTPALFAAYPDAASMAAASGQASRDTCLLPLRRIL